ncbi:MAG: DUF72 domain-containing protein [Abitibacteriaceae bacterium]|nr:DUF72 domain-containing protein [Abditibacteriaceae bacterium]
MASSQRIYLGTSSWKYDDWKSVFYPSGAADELASYARHFDTVEIDSTWYSIPARRVVESWRKRVPDGFRFALKVPRTITHDRSLIDCADEFNAFLHVISYLEDRLGPVLFQFPPHFSAASVDTLRDFLLLLPSGWKFAMEFRHRSWFQQEYADLLETAGVAWAWADTGNLLTSASPLPLYSTASFSYIRWLGDRDAPMAPFNSLKKDCSNEETRWADIIKALPTPEIWGYFNNHWAGYSPGSVDAFKQRLGLPIKEVVEKSEQGTLF